jgi:hypothetical protein
VIDSLERSWPALPDETGHFWEETEARKINGINDLHRPKRVKTGQNDPATAPRARLKKSPDFRR